MPADRCRVSRHLQSRQALTVPTGIYRASGQLPIGCYQSDKDYMYILQIYIADIYCRYILQI